MEEKIIGIIIGIVLSIVTYICIAIHDKVVTRGMDGTKHPDRRDGQRVSELKDSVERAAELNKRAAELNKRAADNVERAAETVDRMAGLIKRAKGLRDKVEAENRSDKL